VLPTLKECKNPISEVFVFITVKAIEMQSTFYTLFYTALLLAGMFHINAM
jgi:hypothetical protein